MPEQNADRVIPLLTVARKAGKLLLGFDAVCDGVRTGSVSCIVLAADCAPRTEKELRYHCPETPLRRLSMNMDLLQMYFRKRTAVFGVCGEGFAKKLISLLPDQEPETGTDQGDS